MHLKINHLYNLHDARYCVSRGVHILTFFVGRNPTKPKIPLSMVWEIAEWVEDAIICLDTGEDRETFTHLLNTIQPSPRIFLQTDVQNILPQFLEQYPYGFIRIQSHIPEELFPLVLSYPHWYFELPFQSTLLNEFASVPKETCFLTLTSFPPTEIHAMESLPNLTMQDFLFNGTELDYEKLDACLDRFPVN